MNFNNKNKLTKDLYMSLKYLPNVNVQKMFFYFLNKVKSLDIHVIATMLMRYINKFFIIKLKKKDGF